MVESSSRLDEADFSLESKLFNVCCQYDFPDRPSEAPLLELQERHPSYRLL